jgi:DNA-binding response OmpR family regulator
MNSEKPNILLVEDDLNLGYLLSEFLESAGYRVKLCRDGERGIKAFHEEQFDLCLLDVMLPLRDGFTVATQIRAINKTVPIIFLTARSLKEDKLKGFGLGADDYISKPFEEDELLARVQAVLRRAKPGETVAGKECRIGKFVFDHKNQELVLDGQKNRLTEKENEILHTLCLHMNNLVRRSDLLKAVWGKDDYFLGRSLDVFITKLRKYFEPDPSVRIENVPRVGFILKVSGPEFVD